ncbi:Repressor of RNA polymerase III transcription maf1 [Diplonema papillatum]|nr:Repressor of RNA polymerase III transcription maf1 [Diplonema papillatum]
MKLLDIDGFAALNGVLGSVQCPGVVVTARLEAYSCKRVSHDKKLAKIIQERAATSPNTVAQQPSPSIMPFPVGFGEDGSFALTPLEYQPSFASDDVSVPLQGDSAEDRAAIVDLITALNVSYSDHDFTDVHPSYFGRETQKSVRAVINNKLSMPSQELRKAGVPDLEAAFWREVDRVVGLKESEFFSYNPPSSESPVESTSWGLHTICALNHGYEDERQPTWPQI